MWQGNWRRELQKIPNLSELCYEPPYTEEFLQDQRKLCDPLADQVVAEIARTHPNRDPADMLALVRERAGTLGGVYEQLMDACETIPPWADFDRMRTGQRLIAAYSPFMGLSLLTGSLVGGAIFKKAAMVTAQTGRLAVRGDISRRLVETAALVFRMSFEGELKPGGEAHDTLMKVRLLHGAIRRWIASSGQWRSHWDEPINQEDLAITLSQFSCLNIRSLLRMGVQLDREQIEAHHHMWRYAGFVLGIQDALLVETFDREVLLYEKMLKHQARPEKAPVEARRILDEVADKVPLLPRRTSRNFFYQVTRHVIGDELVQGLKIQPDPRYPGIAIMRGVGRGFSFVHDSLPGGEDLLYRLGVYGFKRQLAAAERGRDMQYGVKVHDSESRRLGRAVEAA